MRFQVSHKGNIMNLLIGLLLFAAAVVGFGLLLSLPVYWLWNSLVPDLFHLPTITWLQAWGLLVLSGFLFKSSASTSTSSK